MPRVIRSPQAKQDLAEIWEYVARDRVDAADRLIAKVDEIFFMLASSPLAGRARDDISESLRAFPVGRYLLLYCQIAGGVEIIRVIHGQRDLTHLKLQ